ncbi:MAG: universal stress protein [bacterium]
MLALDGEPHTEAAIQWAFRLASVLGIEITGLHVRDPYLKQFHNEIYAQGRVEYLEHVDECLATIAERTTTAFLSAAEGAGVTCDVKVLDGDPCEQLAREADTGAYVMVVVGRQPVRGFAAWRSGNLPAKLTAAITSVPVLLVPDQQ